jgi:hypothetical protein
MVRSAAQLRVSNQVAALHPSRRIAEPVIGRAFARPVGDARQDEAELPSCPGLTRASVKNMHGRAKARPFIVKLMH